jgi:hypothetical protein
MGAGRPEEQRADARKLEAALTGVESPWALMYRLSWNVTPIARRSGV